MGLLSAWKRLAGRLEEAENRALASLAGKVARRPGATIAVVLLVCFGLAAGLLNMKVETKGDRLWVPQDSIPKLNQAFVEANYGVSNRFQRVIVAAPDDAADRNVLTAARVRRYFEVHDEVLALRTAAGHGFEDLCVKTPLGSCYADGLIRFWGASSAAFNDAVPADDEAGDAAVRAAVSVEAFPDGGTVIRSTLFGLTLIEDADGSVLSSEGAYVMYMLRGEFEGGTEELLEFEELLIDTIARREMDGVATYLQSFRSFDDELARTVGSDVPLFASTFAVMIAFCCLALGQRSWVKGRTGLAMAGTGLVFLSIAAAYGLCSLAGVPFTTLTQILPFLLLGIGLDDIFVITNAFNLTDESLPTDRRLEQALYRVGSSITLTTSTNCVAFLLGAWSSLPAVSWFCIYAGMGIAFDYLTQITAFVAMIALSERRIKANRVDVFCCISGARCGRQAAPAPSAHTEEADQGTEVPATSVVPAKTDPPVATDLSPVRGSWLQEFMSNLYGPFLMKTPVKVAVLLVFAGGLAVLGYGASNVGREFPLVTLTPDDSYLRDYFGKMEALEGSDAAGVHFYVYYEDVDYHKKAVQKAIEADTLRFLESPTVAGVVASWPPALRAFAASVPEFATALDDDGFFEDAESFAGSPFHNALCAFLDVPQFKLFRGDIMFSAGDEHLPVGDDACAQADSIRTSRLRFVHEVLWNTEDRIAALLGGQELCAASDVSPPCFAFAFNYVFYEQMRIVIPSLVQNFAVCIAAVLLLCSITLVYPQAVLLLSFVILAIDVDLIGAAHYMGLTINAVTFIQYVMSIGVITDHSAHIVHAFLQQPISLSRNERVIGALAEIGPAVFLGAFSTFLGVAPLALASSEIFRVFFKSFGSIVVFGMIHGFILVPVLLSLVGPKVQVEKHEVPEHLKFSAPSLRHLNIAGDRKAGPGDVEMGAPAARGGKAAAEPGQGTT